MKTLNINIKMKENNDRILNVMEKYEFTGNIIKGQYNLYYLVGEITTNFPISEIAHIIGKDLIDNDIDYMIIKPSMKFEF